MMKGPDVEDVAFVQLVEREHVGSVACAMVIVRDWSTAEEIAQDVFERAYRRWSKVSKMDRPGAWVRRAVINQAISVSRRQSTERRAVSKLNGLGRSNDGAVEVDLRMTPDGLEAAGYDLWSYVRALPESQATAVALHYGADLSVDSVASEMGLSIPAVKSLLHRARGQLRQQLELEEVSR